MKIQEGKEEKKVKFIQYQPAICQYSHPPIEVYADSIEELLKHKYFESLIGENEFFCYSDNGWRNNCLMVQRKDEPFWWVLGFTNVDLDNYGLPKFNPNMYKENKNNGIDGKRQKRTV